MRTPKIGILIVVFTLFALNVQAQVRSIGARSVSLDDGNGNIVLVTIPNPSAPGTFTIPSGGGAASPAGTLSGDILRWDATGAGKWVVSTTATNVGGNFSATFVGNGASVTNVNALTLNGQTNANLHDASLLTGTYAAGSGASITNVNALTLNGQTNANLHDASLLTGTYAALSGASITNVNAATVGGEANAALHAGANVTGTVANATTAAGLTVSVVTAVVAANATTLDNTHTYYIVPANGGVAVAVTAPTAVLGKVIMVENQDATATTGLVVAGNTASMFVYNGTTWKRVP
jgi:hypothetical protein